MPFVKWKVVVNNMNILAFLAVAVGVFFLFTENGRRFFLDTVIRCLSCLICIYIINQIILGFGGDISVKINEITTCVSAIFGLSGIAGLYALQVFFTIT